MCKYIIVNKISETSTTAVEPTHLEAKEEEYDVGPGWQATKWKGFFGFFRYSSEPILGFFQGIWQKFSDACFHKKYSIEIFLYKLTL